MQREIKYIVPPPITEMCFGGLAPKISVEVPDLIRVTAREIRETNAAVQRTIKKMWEPGEDGNVIEVDFKNY